MSARAAVGMMVAGVLAAACASNPTGPAPSEAPAVPMSAPVAAPPPAAPNAPPTITGDLRCISPVGAPHIFPLVLEDPDGDRLSWVAAQELPQGDLSPRQGAGVASGDTIRVTYEPPMGRDENWIRLTVTDGRGGSTTATLYVKNH
jgi:hypothetical protein